MFKSEKLLQAALVAAMLMPFASGARADYYFGVGVGAVKSTGHTDELFADVIGASSEIKTSSTGAKMYWGYAFRPQLAVEVQYAHLGTVAERTWDPAVVDGKASLKVNAWSAALVGRLGSPTLAVIGKVGPYLAEQQTSLSGAVFGVDSKLSGTQSGWMTGVGADWRVAKDWSVRLEWERYWAVAKNLTVNQGGPFSNITNGNGIEVDFFSVGASFHF